MFIRLDSLQSFNSASVEIQINISDCLDVSLLTIMWALCWRLEELSFGMRSKDSVDTGAYSYLFRASSQFPY
jgi:hypothetical protein